MGVRTVLHRRWVWLWLKAAFSIPVSRQSRACIRSRLVLMVVVWMKKSSLQIRFGKRRHRRRRRILVRLSVRSLPVHLLPGIPSIDISPLQLWMCL